VKKEVSSEEWTELSTLLNEFRDFFALGIEELGCTRMTVMEIKKIAGSMPADRETI